VRAEGGRPYRVFLKVVAKVSCHVCHEIAWTGPQLGKVWQPQNDCFKFGQLDKCDRALQAAQLFNSPFFNAPISLITEARRARTGNPHILVVSEWES
jgi:hypothetical protein